jgi:hypothetical protein
MGHRISNSVFIFFGFCRKAVLGKSVLADAGISLKLTSSYVARSWKLQGVQL